MNTKIIFFIFAALLMPLVASADVVEVDGIYYNLIPKGNFAEVAENPERYYGDIVIPEKIMYDDVYYDVTTILGNAFTNCVSLTSITIPNSIRSIEIGAFQNCNNLSAVKIYDLTAWCNIDFKGIAATPLQYAHSLYLRVFTGMT